MATSPKTNGSADALALAKLLDGMGKRVVGWQETAPQIHRFMLRRSQELVESEGQEIGARWPGLEVGEPKWAALKAALGADPRPLRWQPGTRERLIPSLVNARHPLHVYGVRGQDIAFGTRVKYAARHHEGVGTNPFGERIPRRPLVGLSNKGRSRLAQLMAIYIVRGDARGNKWGE